MGKDKDKKKKGKKKEKKEKKKVTYQLVSEQEADLKAGKISITSPIGKGILGKQAGETAEVQAPAGILKFKIEEISA